MKRAGGVLSAPATALTTTDLLTKGRIMAKAKPTNAYHLCKDLTGQRFGRLIVLDDAGPFMTGAISNRSGLRPTRLWRCLCDCGNHITKYTSLLTQGLALSCGCLRRECLTGNKNARKHGEYTTPEGRSWTSMKRRCYDPKIKGFANWGGRGITVCERWLGPDGFVNFLADMGPKPQSPRHSLDRINNDGPYSPENCRWATYSQQASNRRLKSINRL